MCNAFPFFSLNSHLTKNLQKHLKILKKLLKKLLTSRNGCAILKNVILWQVVPTCRDKKVKHVVINI